MTSQSIVMDYFNDEENENAMEVEVLENSDEYVIQIVDPGVEEVHPLALVAVNVDELDVETSSSHEQSPEHLVEEDSSDVEVERTSPLPPAKLETDGSEDVTTKEQTSKKRSHSERDRNNYEDDDDGSICPICLDNWTNTGEHRVCALRCGHLFGLKCVNRWLHSQIKKTCPTCKKKVNGCKDIRYIYAKRLTAVDTSELEKIKRQLNTAIEERNRAQNDLAKYVCREQLLYQEIAQLKALVDNSSKSVPNSNYKASELVKLYMEKSVEVCKYGGSRAFDTKCELDLLVASAKSPTSLFNAFGLKKLNISTFKTLSFKAIHSLQIRDICFHPESNWILTASMDKSFKVVNNSDNSVIHTFSHQMPLWSCCWDLNNTNVLYVGTQSGSVLKYDMRQLTAPISTLSIEGDVHPVVSIASIPAAPGEPLAQGGVVSCKLNSLWVYENNNEEHIRHALSLEGPFVSMKYQPSSRQLLVSSRPNSRTAYSRHTLCTLERKDYDKVGCNIIHSFPGGGMQKLLSKSCFVSHINNYVAAHQENSKSVYLWSINTGAKVSSIPAHESVLDLKGFSNSNGSFLVSLTEKKLEFHKFITS